MVCNLIDQEIRRYQTDDGFSSVPPDVDPGGDAPSAITDLAVSVSSTTATLTWTANGGTVSVYRRNVTAGGSFALVVGGISGAATSYSDSGLTPETEYQWRITSTNQYGTSPNSNTVSATTGDLVVNPRQFAPGYFMPAKYPLNSTNSIVTPRPDNETHQFAFVRNGYVGMQYELKINIFEGAFPHYFELLQAPAGATLGETIFDADYGVIKWTPSTTGVVTFQIRVTDQDGTQIERTWTVNVNTNWIRFVSTSGSDSTGDGTFANPWRTLGYALDNTIGGRAICLRSGTYAEAMTGKSTGTSFANCVFGYNGETVTIDMSNYIAGSAHGVFMVNSSDFTLFNLRLVNPPTNTPDPRWASSFAVTSRMIMDRCYVDINNRSGTQNFDNISAFFLGDAGAPRSHCAQTRCTFTRFRGESNGWSSFDTYGTNYFVCEENTFFDQAAPAGTGSGVMWVKATGSRYFTIRRNTFLTPWAGSILDLQLSNNSTALSTGDIVVSYNKLYGPATQSTNNIVFSVGRGTGIAARGPVHSFRNTIYGNCAVWLRDWELSFSSENDVIITDATYSGKAHNVLGRSENTADNVWLNPATRQNLTLQVIGTECHGNTSAGIVDASLNLNGSFVQYLGTRGAQIVSGAAA